MQKKKKKSEYSKIFQMDFVPVLRWSSGWIMEVWRRSWRVSPLPPITKPSTAAGQVHHTCRHEQRCFIINSNRADQLRSNRHRHRPIRIRDRRHRRLCQRQNHPPYDGCYKWSAKEKRKRKRKSKRGRNVLVFGGSDRKEKKKEGKEEKE